MTPSITDLEQIGHQLKKFLDDEAQAGTGTTMRNRFWAKHLLKVWEGMMAAATGELTTDFVTSFDPASVRKTKLYPAICDGDQQLVMVYNAKPASGQRDAEFGHLLPGGRRGLHAVTLHTDTDGARLGIVLAQNLDMGYLLVNMISIGLDGMGLSYMYSIPEDADLDAFVLHALGASQADTPYQYTTWQPVDADMNHSPDDIVELGSYLSYAFNARPL